MKIINNKYTVTFLLILLLGFLHIIPVYILLPLLFVGILYVLFFKFKFRFFNIKNTIGNIKPLSKNGYVILLCLYTCLAILSFFPLSYVPAFQESLILDDKFMSLILIIIFGIYIITLQLKQQIKNGYIGLCILSLGLFFSFLFLNIVSGVKLGGLVNLTLFGFLTILISLLSVLVFYIPKFQLNDIDNSNSNKVSLDILKKNHILSIFCLIYVLYYVALFIYLSDNVLEINLLFLLIMLYLSIKRMSLISYFKFLLNNRLLIPLLLIVLIMYPLFQDINQQYNLNILVNTMIFAITAMGLNIVVGYAGLLDIGYIAFLGIGSYVAAIFSSSSYSPIHIHLPIIAVSILAILCAMIFSLIIGFPTLILRGDYLAIVTLGFGEIFRIVVNNLDNNSGFNLTNGPNGISGLTNLKLFDIFNLSKNYTIDLSFIKLHITQLGNYYLLILLMLLIVIFVVYRFSKSKLARALFAVNYDEDIALSLGINTFRLKLFTFIFGASLAGFIGVMNAYVKTSVTPDQFQFMDSINLLAAVILGGSGTVMGPILGSSLLIMLPEKLRFLHDWRLFFFGLILIIIMQSNSEGLIKNIRILTRGSKS